MRPTLSTRRCIASPEESYSVSCSCNKCNSRPSLQINSIDSEMSKREIEIIIKKLEMGSIRQIELEGTSVKIYFKQWSYTMGTVRTILQSKRQIKLHFTDAYEVGHTWYAESVEDEPRWINPRWEEDVEATIELPADDIDLEPAPTSEKRRDGKSEATLQKERNERDLYYYIKNVYQTYDLNSYDEKVEKHGEGFMWSFTSNLSKESFTKKFMKRWNYQNIYLQTNWILQAEFHWRLNNGKKEYYPRYFSPKARPIKDRVYEPARKKIMLNILANWSEVGSRPYWLCSGLTTILDDRNDYSAASLKKFIPDNQKSSNINVISGIGALQLNSERTNKYTYKYTIIYKKIERWAKMMKVPTFTSDENVPLPFSTIKAHSPYVISTWNDWSFNLSPFQLKLKSEILSEKDRMKERVMEQTFYFKNIVMEELNARFWFCVERKSLINVDNLVGSTGESRYNLAKQAKEYYNTLYNGSKKIEDYQSTDIPQEFSPYEQQDCWCNCGKVNECEECRSTMICYGCYFCNRLHVRPREWREWQELYQTTPRCGCQYRIITQERLAEAKEHPDRFNNV